MQQFVVGNIYIYITVYKYRVYTIFSVLLDINCNRFCTQIIFHDEKYKINTLKSNLMGCNMQTSPIEKKYTHKLVKLIALIQYLFSDTTIVNLVDEQGQATHLCLQEK